MKAGARRASASTIKFGQPFPPAADRRWSVVAAGGAGKPMTTIGEAISRSVSSVHQNVAQRRQS